MDEIALTAEQFESLSEGGSVEVDGTRIVRGIEERFALDFDHAFGGDDMFVEDIEEKYTGVIECKVEDGRILRPRIIGRIEERGWKFDGVNGSGGLLFKPEE